MANATDGTHPTGMNSFIYYLLPENARTLFEVLETEVVYGHVWLQIFCAFSHLFLQSRPLAQVD